MYLNLDQLNIYIYIYIYIYYWIALVHHSMKTGKLTAFQNTGARSEVPGSDSTYIKEY